MAADPGHIATFIVLTPLARMAQCVSLAVSLHYPTENGVAARNLRISVSHDTLSVGLESQRPSPRYDANTLPDSKSADRAVLTLIFCVSPLPVSEKVWPDTRFRTRVGDTIRPWPSAESVVRSSSSPSSPWGRGQAPPSRRALPCPG